MKEIKRSLIIKLQDVAKKLNQSPTEKEFAKNTSIADAQAAMDAFGSWRCFLEAAELELNKREQAKSELVKQLQEFVREQHKIPTEKVFLKEVGTVSVSVILNLFGSWDQLLKEAGFKKVPQYTRYRRDELLEQVNRLAKELNETPTIETFRKAPNTASIHAITNEFGSWSDFIREAGLSPRHRHPKNKQTEPSKEKTPPAAPELATEPAILAPPAPHTRVEDKLAIPKPINLRYYTKSKLVKQVKKLAKDLGKTPTYKEFNGNPKTASGYTVQRFFGTWNKFLKIAGLKVNQTHKKGKHH